MRRLALLALVLTLPVAACALEGDPVPGCRTAKDCPPNHTCAPKTGVCLSFRLPLGELADAAPPDAPRRPDGPRADAPVQMDAAARD